MRRERRKGRASCCVFERQAQILQVRVFCRWEYAYRRCRCFLGHWDRQEVVQVSLRRRNEAVFQPRSFPSYVRKLLVYFKFISRICLFFILVYPHLVVVFVDSTYWASVIHSLSTVVTFAIYIERPHPNTGPLGQSPWDSSLNMACRHKSNIGCALTALPTCCSCADQRPLAAAYPVYVDGEGMKMQGKRWSRYCWKCRDYWDLEYGLDLIWAEQTGNRSTIQNPTRSFPTPRPAAVRRDRQIRMSPLDLRGGESTLQTRNHRRRGDPSTRTARPDHSEIVTDSESRPRRSRQARQNPLVATFGTREEIEAEGYQSPISTMFERWEDRHRTAEVRRSQLENEISDQLGMLRRQTSDVINPFQAREQVEQATALTTRSVLSIHSTPPSAESVAQHASRIANFVAEHASHSHPRLYNADPPRPNPIDTQASRPPALSQAEMTMSIACQICNEQRSDILLNPCSHMCMCHWCSEILKADAAAAKKNGGPTRTSNWRCPICRKAIAGVTRVYLC